MAGVAVASPKQQYLDGDGIPLAGGFIYTYAAGTFIPKTTWQDRDQLVQNQNPIELDEFGSAQILLDPALAYRFEVTDADGMPQPHLSEDNIVGAAGTQILTDVTAAGDAALAAIAAASTETMADMEAVRDETETARDAAFTIAGLYPDTAAALADVGLVVNKYFGVLSAASSEVAIVYQKTAGPTATDTGRRVPSTGLLMYPRPISETVGTGLGAGTRGESGAASIQTWLNPSTVDGFIGSISFEVSAPGFARIHVYELISGSNFNHSRMIDFKTVAGLNSFNAPADFDYVRLPVGSRVGGQVKSGSTNIQSLSNGAVTGARSFLATDSVYVGQVAVLQAPGAADLRIPSIQYTIVHPDTILAANTKLLAETGAGRVVTYADLTAARRGKRTLNRQSFPGVATPANWTLNGWTPNNGLIAPAVPGFATHARWDVYENFQYAGIHARFLVTDAATSRFGIFVEPTQVSFGGAVQIDAAASKMICYLSNAGAFTSLEPTFNKFVAIPALVSGREYLLSTRLVGLDKVHEWRDCTTNQVTLLTSLFSNSTHDHFQGRPGLVYTAGAANGVTLKYFEVAAHFDAPKIIVLGDSNAWGGSMSDIKLDDWKRSWPNLLDASRQRGDVVVAGRGGETAATIATSLLANHVTLWNPDYFVIAAGSNDTVLATWRTNMATIIAACVARGAQVVLCTIPPRADRQAFINSANADLFAKFFGDYPVIDFASALSVANDRVTQVAAAFVDLVHMNAFGHGGAFEQLKSDAPFLLRN